jgi:hypothetical protein
MGDEPKRAADASRLSALGTTLFTAGIALLVLAVSALNNVIPPRMGQLTNIFLGFALGFIALVTGFLYTQVAASGEDPEVGANGLSLTRDPLTGAREWIKIESIAQATLRPRTISPWPRTGAISSLSSRSRRVM